MEQELPKPLVSDDQISDAFMYGPLVKDAMHGYLSGANYARDIYEPELQRLRSQVEAMRVALVDSNDELASAMPHLPVHGQKMALAQINEVKALLKDSPTPTTEAK